VVSHNNASGMCCGTANNSYHTLAGMRVVPPTEACSHSRRRPRGVCARPSAPSADWLSSGARRAKTRLAGRIRHKFGLKNTTGYSLGVVD
jgi:D-lactate dehydrogenase